MGDRKEAIRAAMIERGATYSDGSFYGLAHETAHGIALNLDRCDRDGINDVLSAMPSRLRMVHEVIANIVARQVCTDVGVPIFADSVRYSARSVLMFARSRGEDVRWAEEDYIWVDGMFENEPEVTRISDEILAMGEGR